MKKSFLLLPIMALGLAACVNNGSENTEAAEVTSVPNWQITGVAPAQMPPAMQQPSYTPPMPSSSQPTYMPPAMVEQPTYTPQPLPTTPTTNFYGQVENVGNCQVVRNSNNQPVYSQIVKGCYQDAIYTVNKGDTLFLISYLTGKAPEELAKMNKLEQPYQLSPNQVLRVK